MENNTSLQQQLLEAGVHFGHLKKKWNPKMLPYIFAEKKGIHIIDLNKTLTKLEEAVAGTDKEAITTALSELFVASNAINEVKQSSTTQESTTPDSDDNVVDAEFKETKDKN